MADSQAAHTISAETWVKIPVQLDEQGATNAARELRQLWMYLEDIHPTPKLKVTRDGRGYYFYLNGVALRYLITYASKLPPFKLKEEEPINLDDIPF